MFKLNADTVCSFALRLLLVLLLREVWPSLRNCVGLGPAQADTSAQVVMIEDGRPSLPSDTREGSLPAPIPPIHPRKKSVAIDL